MAVAGGACDSPPPTLRIRAIRKRRQGRAPEQENALRRIVAVSDFCDVPPVPTSLSPADFERGWAADAPLAPPAGRADVTGGYLERLPLAAVATGLADAAEVWSFCGRDAPDAFDSAGIAVGLPPSRGASDRPDLVRRVFRADGHSAPYGSADAVAHVRRHGAPAILCVWGLGIDKALLEACSESLKVYNSIDAPAIRIPPEVSRHFDLFLTGAEWQSDEIRARHPGALCAVLPIGPEFASDDTFHPTGAAKDYDVVYVAATQPYKRHDLLLDTLERLPHLRALCVVGYGHLTDELRRSAEARGLSVDWIGPLGHDGVNRAINRARVGVVCGVEDGAPAILTEYMLAGLPVLANDRLVCGLQYIRPDTGLAASEDRFAEGLEELLRRAPALDPRAVVQANWTWPHSVRRLAGLLDHARERRRERVSA